MSLQSTRLSVDDIVKLLEQENYYICVEKGKYHVARDNFK